MTTNKICRLCLVITPIALPIINTKAAEMLEMLTAIKVEPTDEVLMMCLKCNLNLKLAHVIQQKFVRSDERLKRGFLNEQTNEKDKQFVKFEEVMIADNLIKKEAPDLPEYVICDEVTTNESLFSQPEEHFNYYKQFCDLCGQTFSDIKSYRIHLLEHSDRIHFEDNSLEPTNEEKNKPEVDLPFPCEICGKKFVSKVKLRHHKEGHRRKECPICKKSFASYNFYKHVKNHKTGPQVCEHCGKTYKSAENLRGHIYYQHGERIYECKECKITFTNRHSLNYHRKSRHGIESGHVCETCGRKFVQAYDLKKHVMTTHMKMRPYVCEFCNKSFAGHQAMKTHRLLHTNETPYKCEECGEGFRQKGILRAHRKSKHNVIETMTCKCEICGRGFSTVHGLRSHMRSH